MEINSLIKILKDKLTKEIKINNIEIEDKSFLHKKHKNFSKDKFYINKIETDSNNNQEIIDDILNLIQGTNIKTKEKFDVLVNLGPGSFSGIRISLAVAKGIKLIKKVN